LIEKSKQKDMSHYPSIYFDHSLLEKLPRRDKRFYGIPWKDIISEISSISEVIELSKLKKINRIPIEERETVLKDLNSSSKSLNTMVFQGLSDFKSAIGKEIFFFSLLIFF
jgi:hypothetical protein